MRPSSPRKRLRSPCYGAQGGQRSRRTPAPRGARQLTLRVLHTADWHLGDRLGGIDRLPDQLARLRELVAHAEERRVDALLVCGDVLEAQRAERLATIVSRLAELLAPCVERGMQCVFLAGNHDSAHTFELLRGVQRLLGERRAAQVSFAGEPALVPLTADGETAAALVALPYPTAAAYGLPGDLRTVEDKRAELSDAVSDACELLSARAQREHPGVPLLMAGHFLLRHVDAPTGLREVPELEDVHVEGAPLDRFAYVALGHVHEPLALAERIRYSGALDRVDFAEADRPRHVVLAEVARDGGLTLEELPLDATPMRRIDVGALSEIAQRARALEEPERTIVKLELRLERSDVASLWLAQARREFPRLFAPVDLIRLDEPDPPVLTGAIEHASPPETVRAFLADQLALAERLLGEEGLLTG